MNDSQIDDNVAVSRAVRQFRRFNIYWYWHVHGPVSSSLLWSVRRNWLVSPLPAANVHSLNFWPDTAVMLTPRECLSRFPLRLPNFLSVDCEKIICSQVLGDTICQLDASQRT